MIRPAAANDEQAYTARLERIMRLDLTPARSFMTHMVQVADSMTLPAARWDFRSITDIGRDGSDRGQSRAERYLSYALQSAANRDISSHRCTHHGTATGCLSTLAVPRA